MLGSVSPRPGRSCFGIESAGDGMPRFLRPAYLIPCREMVWLVDEYWPVAAALDAAGIVTVVGWRAPDAAGQNATERTVVADGMGIVVQDGEQVAWARPAGSTVQHVGRGLTLVAGDPEVAWFADRTAVDPGDPRSAPVAERMPLPPGRIVALGRDGTRRTVLTPRPVTKIDIAGSDVVVTLARRPVAHAMGSTGWRFEYPTSTVQVDRDELFVDGLARAVAVPADKAGPGAGRSGGWSWLESDPHLVRRYGVSSGGLLWWAGAPTDGDRIDRRAIVVGHGPTAVEEVLRIDLGPGLVHSVHAVGDELWVAVARRRSLAFVPRDRGVDVLAVSPMGTVRVVHSADSIDVIASAPPLRRPASQEIEDHVRRVSRMFENLDEYWRTADGVTQPLVQGLTDPSVAVEGGWPRTRLLVTLKHPQRPGVLLRRTLPLFDDAGQPIDHEYAVIHLMEDLDTHHIAPATEAVDGVLDT
jgi:hypothetical protein